MEQLAVSIVIKMGWLNLRGLHVTIYIHMLHGPNYCILLCGLSRDGSKLFVPSDFIVSNGCVLCIYI